MADILDSVSLTNAYSNLSPKLASIDSNTVNAIATNAGFIKAKEFLKSVFTQPYTHKTAIVLGALLNGTNAVTSIHRFGGSELLNTIVSAIGFPAQLLAAGLGSVASATGIDLFRSMNALFDELKNPNIGGIPIHADSETESHDSDVGQHLLIRQSTQNKEYVADNVVPKPITWTIKGYLMAQTNAIDANLVIKPSLLAQRMLLEYYKETRMPVVFKTHDNRFYTVLISHFDSSYTVQALNALQVNLTLVEFNAMMIDSEDIALNELPATKE